MLFFKIKIKKPTSDSSCTDCLGGQSRSKFFDFFDVMVKIKNRSLDFGVINDL